MSNKDIVDKILNTLEKEPFGNINSYIFSCTNDQNEVITITDTTDKDINNADKDYFVKNMLIYYCLTNIMANSVNMDVFTFLDNVKQNLYNKNVNVNLYNKKKV